MFKKSSLHPPPEVQSFIEKFDELQLVEPFRAFGALVITTFAVALKESGLPVDREHLLRAIETQGASIPSDNCSPDVQVCLDSIRIHNALHFQRVVVHAVCAISTP